MAQTSPTNRHWGENEKQLPHREGYAFLQKNEKNMIIAGNTELSLEHTRNKQKQLILDRQ